MARFYYTSEKQQQELYDWLKTRPWVKRKTVAVMMAGYVLGLYAEIMHVWDQPFWTKRTAGTWRVYWKKDTIVREITEVFYKNGEGFVDRIVIMTPKLCWYNDYKGERVYVQEGVHFNKKRKSRRVSV